jgi:hypothetical protein
MRNGCNSRAAKQVQIILAANEYAAGNITLDEYGSQTKEIPNDP